MTRIEIVACTRWWCGVARRIAGCRRASAPMHRGDADEARNQADKGDFSAFVQGRGSFSAESWLPAHSQVCCASAGCPVCSTRVEILLTSQAVMAPAMISGPIPSPGRAVAGLQVRSRGTYFTPGDGRGKARLGMQEAGAARSIRVAAVRCRQQGRRGGCILAFIRMDRVCGAVRGRALLAAGGLCPSPLCRRGWSMFSLVTVYLSFFLTAMFTDVTAALVRVARGRAVGTVKADATLTPAARARATREMSMTLFATRERQAVFGMVFGQRKRQAVFGQTGPNSFPPLRHSAPG